LAQAPAAHISWMAVRVAPRLQVENEPLQDLHCFGAARFHRSMGPAVGLIKMTVGKQPRRHTPAVATYEVPPNHALSSSSKADLFVRLRTAEIGDDEGLAVAALLGGFTKPTRHMSSPNLKAPVAPGCSGSTKKHRERARSPRDCNSPGGSTLFGASREGSQVFGGSSEGSLFLGGSREGSRFLVGDEDDGKAAFPCAEDMIPQALESALPRRGAAPSPGVFPAFAAVPSPDHWRRAQKRPVKLGSAYSTRMQAILLM